MKGIGMLLIFIVHYMHAVINNLIETFLNENTCSSNYERTTKIERK